MIVIRKARLLQVSHHMGRDSEKSSYFIDLGFSGFPKLCLFRKNGNRSILHSVFQDRDLVTVVGSAKCLLPALSAK